MRLTGGEAALLTVLARKPNEVLSREDIVAALDMDETGERAIDVMVTRLRRKLEADPREPRFLHTVRGRGLRAEAGPLRPAMRVHVPQGLPGSSACCRGPCCGAAC